MPTVTLPVYTADGIGLLGVFNNHKEELGNSWFSPGYHQIMVGASKDRDDEKMG